MNNSKKLDTSVKLIKISFIEKNLPSIFKIKFFRGIIMYSLGTVTIFISLLYTDSSTYGAVNPTTLNGVVTLMGSIISFIGLMVMLYDGLRFIFNLLGVKTR